ncbi:MAG: tryptophan--tRNA ligase [Candidatus Omnitrophica bacterium]|nr:tryptophan--tRNA ligase [Candidatus Omnitrophota bacterium]
MKKRILSGMRPTGKLHLGHLVGAIDNWIKLQDEYDCYYMIADWHALMSEYASPENIKENIFECAVDWLSCGLDPERSSIFIQSDVSQHLDLYMALSCLTPLSWLERCPTYKEQLREVTTRDLTTYAFLGYPVLQAADILLYKANVVPVGVDQSSHLELTREIVRRFHHIYKKEIFPEPETLLTHAPKLLGLDSRKMSKSYDNFIALSETDEDIVSKVKQMITDPARIQKTDPGHPDICNVFSYYKVFASKEVHELEEKCKAGEIGCMQCKKHLAEIIIERLRPIRQKREKLIKDKKFVMDVLGKGKQKAQDTAKQTMKEVRELIGFLG